MRAYRSALATIHGPAVPLFPIVLKDATFVVEGNPANYSIDSKLNTDDADSGTSNPPLINLDKYRTLVAVATAYLDIVKEAYPFETEFAKSSKHASLERIVEDRLLSSDDESGWPDIGVNSTIWNMMSEYDT